MLVPLHLLSSGRSNRPSDPARPSHSRRAAPALVAALLLAACSGGGGDEEGTTEPEITGSDIAELASIVLSAGAALSPEFDPATTEYTLTVSETTAETTVTATLADARGTLTVDGAEVASGVASAPVPLAPGGITSIAIAVTAEDQTTVKTYTVSVAAVLSANADLASLTVSAGAIAPAFAADTTRYELTITPTILSTTVTATVADERATLKINGKAVQSGETSLPIGLTAGASTIIPVTVTAGDRTTIKTYTVDVVSVLSANADLAGLELSVGPLSPAFDPDISAYTIASDLLDESTTLTATAADPAAALSVNFQLATSGVPIGPFPLVSGSDSTFEVRVTAEDAKAKRTYTVTVVPGFEEEAYVKASNTEAQDQFGTAVAIDGDTLVVGAPFEGADAPDTALQFSGAVYVYERTGSTWTQQAFLEASNADELDRFGTSVAISGDTIAVGAPGEASGVVGDPSDDGAASAGAVYVFTRSAGVWTQEAYLKASNAGAGDQFGTCVALQGDTLAVGAPGEASDTGGVDGNELDDSADNAGAAYVFTRDAGVWSQDAYVKASNSAAGDRFGTSIAVYEEKLAVGAPSEASNATGVAGDQSNDDVDNAGAVYVYERGFSSWSQEAYVKASNTGRSDRFGTSVALAAGALAVGAPGEASNDTGISGDQTSDSLPFSGAVYVFERGPDFWSQDDYVKASNTGGGDQFGSTVALSGTALAVGALQEASAATGIDGDETDDTALGAGAVYLFTRSVNSWDQRAYVKASNTELTVGLGGDAFGSSLALSGDTLVVGAPLEDGGSTGLGGDPADNSASSAGAVYVLR